MILVNYVDGRFKYSMNGSPEEDLEAMVSPP
jgi:hypothetical protein